MSARDDTEAYPIARSAGISRLDIAATHDSTEGGVDPFVAFDELMELVEALHPDGPPLPRPITRGIFRL